MAHAEHDMRPPDLDPGAIGAYRITHACIIDGVQILHMELSGLNMTHPHAMGKPYDASAVVHNPRGHAAASAFWTWARHGTTHEHVVAC